MNRNDCDVIEVFNNLLKKHYMGDNTFEISSIETSDLLNSMRRCSTYTFDYLGYYFTHPKFKVKLNFIPTGGIITIINDK